jgi:hypothetical protein
MLKDFFKGINIGLGILFIFALIFGVVYAVGFHSASEIIGGTFNGDYTFNGSVSIESSNSNASLDVGGSINVQEICDNNGSNCKNLSGGWFLDSYLIITKEYDSPGTYTFTVPENVNEIIVQLWGAGGGGGAHPGNGRGGVGGNTTFNSSFLIATGGKAGPNGGEAEFSYAGFGLYGDLNLYGENGTWSSTAGKEGGDGANGGSGGTWSEGTSPYSLGDGNFPGGGGAGYVHSLVGFAGRG